MKTDENGNGEKETKMRRKTGDRRRDRRWRQRWKTETQTEIRTVNKAARTEKMEKKARYKKIREHKNKNTDNKCHKSHCFFAKST